MDTRALGSTGVQVSPLCLGAMMFGAWGNPDHDESVAIIHRALDSGINFIDTADVYSAGESEQIVGKALAGGRRDNVVLATKAHGPMGATSTSGVTRGAGSSANARTACAARHRLHRPVSDPPPRAGDRYRRDAGRAFRPDQGRQDLLRGHSTFPADARSSRRSGRRSGEAGSDSSASSRRTRSWSAASRPTCCPPASATAWA